MGGAQGRLAAICRGWGWGRWGAEGGGGVSSQPVCICSTGKGATIFLEEVTLRGVQVTQQRHTANVITITLPGHA